jgi:hypothetical protein
VLEESCLPYAPEAAAGSPSRASKACQRTCNNIAPELTMTGGGTFVQTILPDPVTVQQYIRRVGGVVTRFEVHSDFEDFFKGNATAVYPGPGKGAAYILSEGPRHVQHLALPQAHMTAVPCRARSRFLDVGTLVMTVQQLLQAHGIGH